MLLPALSRAKQSGQGMTCLNNKHQLMLAGLMYADDYQGLLFPNQPYIDPGQVEWCTQTNNWNPGVPDNTNSAKLVDPRFSKLGPYVLNPGVFKCPGDLSFVPHLGARVRSVSASQSVGTLWTNVTSCYPNLQPNAPVTGQWLTGSLNDCQTTWRTYGKISDMTAPTPAGLWVFIDESPDTIDDACFAVQMADLNQFINVPSAFHNSAGTLSFADGHSELHKWTGAICNQPVIPGNAGGNPSINRNASGDFASQQDIAWLQQRTSAPR